MSRVLHSLLVASLLLCLGSAAHATTVYRTVDKFGAVSFSDTPPDNAALPAEELRIATPSTGDAQVTQRLQDMRETTERMIASRMARERHRAELRKLNAETDLSRAAAEAPLPQDDYAVYRDPLYLVPPRRHRIAPNPRPPIRATAAPVRSSYPSSLIRRHYNPQVRDFFER